MALVSLLAWGWLAWRLCVTEPSPALPLTVAVAVGVYLHHDARALRTLEGAPRRPEDSGKVTERGQQVATVAFALGTLLLSQQGKAAARRLAPGILTGLLLVLLPLLSSGEGARRLGFEEPLWEEAQRAATSLGAGVMCVALAKGLASA